MSQVHVKSLTKWIGLGVLIIVLGFSVGKLPLKAGQIDFRAYWSASYLLARGENFADEHSLLTTQQDLTGFNKEYAMKTWNPPWILVWLLPYTWVRFDTAANLWLMTNVMVLLVSIVVCWQMLFPTNNNRQRWLWLPLLAAILFPSTIVSLMFGQVNLIVLGGVVGFLAFYTQGRDHASGLALALTTFKPHLVYLIMPIIILHSWRQRRWGVSATFFGLLAFSTVIALILRPTLFSDYFQGTTAGNLLAWETATVVTYLSLKTGWLWIRLIAVLLLPLTLLLWFFQAEKWNLMQVAQVGVLASILTMPFGWSYDFVLLLLPLMQILVWVTTANMLYREKMSFMVILVGVYAAYYAQRVTTPSELYFFWVPLVIAALYGWMAWRTTGKHPA